MDDDFDNLNVEEKWKNLSQRELMFAENCGSRYDKKQKECIYNKVIEMDKKIGNIKKLCTIHINQDIKD